MIIRYIIAILALTMLSCRQTTNVDNSTDDFISLFRKDFVGNEPMSLEDVVLKCQIVDKWSGDDLDRKVVNVDGDMGFSTFVFRVRTAPEKVEYDITIKKSDSLDWDKCKDKEVVSIGLSVGQTYIVCRLKEGVYAIREK